MGYNPTQNPYAPGTPEWLQFQQQQGLPTTGPGGAPVIPGYAQPAAPSAPPPPPSNPITGFDPTQAGTEQGSIYQSMLGGGWTPTNAATDLNSIYGQFSQTFQNLTGSPPAQADWNNFFGQIGPQVLNSAQGYSGTNYSDWQNLMNSYIQNAYPQQIQSAQTQNQTSALNNTESQVQNLVNTVMGNTAKNLSDPNSSTYQSFAGTNNNSGITPGSGAFQAGAGSTIANAGVQAANTGLTSVGLPALSGIQGLSSAPYAQTLTGTPGGLATYGQNTTGAYQFNQEEQLAQLLAQMGQPSGTQQDIGMASGAASGLGSLLGGGAKAYGATWICTQMKREGILTGSEVELLHNHLFKAIWKRPFKFMGYFLFGKFVVLLANALGVNWREWEPHFYEVPIEIDDSVEAVDLYALAFWFLVSDLKHRLRVKMTIAYHQGVR